MQNYKQQFKGKKITVMGLGILGRGLGYTKFLAECGADLIVTDLKTKEQLATSINALSKYKNIKFVLGGHSLEDFRNRDMVIKAAGVPLDSIYIAEAKKNSIPVEMDVSLFAKCAKDVMLIGVTGTRGKSMTTTLIYEILKNNSSSIKRMEAQGKIIKNINVYPGGNLRGVATLPLLKKVKAGDILVCELDSWQLQGFGDAGISPHISVFTTFMPDHMNYYKDNMEKYFDDKANIFKYQNKDDILVVLPEVKKLLPKNIKSKLIVVGRKEIEDWKFIVPGNHQRDNLSCAVLAAKQLNIPDSKIKKTVALFEGLEGRLQFLKTYKGVKIYNDNNATTPEAAIAGIEALSSCSSQGLIEKKIVLIFGGASKNLSLDNLIKTINKNCKAVVMIPGTGTEQIKRLKIKVESHEEDNLKKIVAKAIEIAKKGDTILFSPAFASFGMFNNEYERNDLFMKIIKKLK